MAHLFSQSLVSVLDQGIYLLDMVDDVVYNRTVAQAFDASVGIHYRHCIDHFQSLVCGRSSVEVDYDDRERDSRIEVDRDFARQRTQQLRQKFASLEDTIFDTEVRVRCKVCATDFESPLVKSTLGREAMYAVVHAMHHYALISVMCRIQGVEMDAKFGVAPSTQAFRERMEC